MSDRLLIYGATGYTGRLVAEAALALGLRPILGGRSEPALAETAARLGLPYRVASLLRPDQLTSALRDVDVVVNAAGPFSQTAQHMVEACMRTRTHYLDVTGEIPVIEALAGRAGDARRSGIMVMPAVGFDVVPSDCLVAHVARRVGKPSRLRIGLAGLRFATPGSAKTLAEHAGSGIVVRRGGHLEKVPAGSLRHVFPYGHGPDLSFNISWGDVATAWYSTGVADIEVYFQANAMLQAMLLANRTWGWLLATEPWQALLKAGADMLPEGQSAAQRAATSMIIVAEVESGRHRARARLRTPEAYTFTGLTAAAIARQALRGNLEIGFQTPSRVYGSDFVLSFPGVVREDLQ